MLKYLPAAVWLLVLPMPSAQAQEAPRPEVLVQAWAASQAPRVRALGRIELREWSQWTLDGPFGARRLQMTARVVGGPDVGDWEREPISVEVDGRRVEPERWEALQRRRRNMTGPHAETATRSILQILPMLGKLEPAGHTTQERIDGLRCWRVDLVPRDRSEAIERVTLWLDRAQGHLVRSRAVVNARRSDVPILITTDYRRVEGLDVPDRRTIEGTARTRRRLRSYTLLFAYEATYDAYRFFGKR